MRKYLIGLATLALLFSFSCAPKTSMIQNGTTYAGMEGFLDNDTLQVKAVGFAKDDVTDKIRRKRNAHEAALIQAQARIVELLVGANITGKSATENGELIGDVVKKEIGGMMQGGHEVSSTYDNETQACEIIYQINAPGLKQKAQKAKWGN